MPMDNTVIQIKYSTANGKPLSLNVGELAYSYTTNTLFVGTSSNGVINIGGVAMAHYIENRSTVALPDTLVLRDNAGGITANNLYGNLIGGSNTSQQFFFKEKHQVGDAFVFYPPLITLHHLKKFGFMKFKSTKSG